MIVARIINSDNNLPLVNIGGIRMSPYNGERDGWFPVDGFNFGFKEQQQDAAQAGAPAAHGAPGKTAAPPPAAKGAPGAKGGKPQDFAEITITKQVDTASASLMYLCMKERKSKKGTSKEQETPLEADIHVVSSLALALEKGDRSTYTSLMIHLEAVNVLNWEIQASGDARPTETVRLRYDRAAMLYVGTKDGQVFHFDPPKGWNQTENKEFVWNTGKMEKYFPPTELRV